MSAIVVENLSKVFRQDKKEPGIKGALKHLVLPQYINKVAVDNISMVINKGEAVAYLGPNGAGKSTTIKMLTGILVPTTGKVIVNDINPSKNRIENAKNIGAVFGQRTQLWWDIPLMESLNVLKDLYSVPKSIYLENMEMFCDLLDLKSFLHLPARKLSLGQRMRADLAASLLHNPSIVFLDEPTIGLDIEVKAKIRKFIKDINKMRNTTIILTTHDLEDIEDICNRIIIIDHGKIICDGDLISVRDSYARERKVIFKYISRSQDFDLSLQNQSGVTNYGEQNGEVTIGFDKYTYSAGDILKMFMKYGEIDDFRVIEPGMDKVIEGVYQSNKKVVVKV